MTREDAALLLTELRYDLSGKYSCRVELYNGEAQEAAPWEVLILGESRHPRLILIVFSFSIQHYLNVLPTYRNCLSSFFIITGAWQHKREQKS